MNDRCSSVGPRRLPKSSTLARLNSLSVHAPDRSAVCEKGRTVLQRNNVRVSTVSTFFVDSLNRAVLEENRSIKTVSETFLSHFIGNVNYLEWLDPLIA
jgi:hypothetical protein